MRLAILTDIHANREAFQAVLADLAPRGIDQIILLGDIVGYGPDPEACCDLAADLVARGALAVRGNHDQAIAAPDPGFSRNALAAINWTRPRLSAAQTAFLAGLPMQVRLDDLLFVHASPQDPANWIYIDSVIMAVGAFRAARDRVIFCGHVHVPQLYTLALWGTVQQMRIPIARELPLIRSRRWLCVVGAVGQPRDGNPSAGYAIYDQTTAALGLRRVPYDCGATAAKVRAAGLPERLATRLLSGD